MNLISLIEQLKDSSVSVERLAPDLSNVPFEQIDVYLKGKIAEDSEVRLFDAEKIENRSVISVNDEILVNLFPLYMIRDAMREYPQSASPEDIARGLIDYQVHDA